MSISKLTPHGEDLWQTKALATPARGSVVINAFFFLFFAQAGAVSFVAIWLEGPVGPDRARAGTGFVVNVIAPMACLPIYAYPAIASVE